MTAFLKFCFFVMLTYWVWDETGPVTILLLALMLVDTSLLNDRLNNLISAHSAGLSLEAYRLKKSVEKYGAGGKG